MDTVATQSVQHSSQQSFNCQNDSLITSSPMRLRISQLLINQAQKPKGLTQQYIANLLSNKIKVYRDMFSAMNQQKKTREVAPIIQELHDEIQVLACLYQRTLYNRLAD